MIKKPNKTKSEAKAKLVVKKIKKAVVKPAASVKPEKKPHSVAVTKKQIPLAKAEGKIKKAAVPKAKVVPVVQQQVKEVLHPKQEHLIHKQKPIEVTVHPAAVPVKPKVAVIHKIIPEKVKKEVALPVVVPEKPKEVAPPVAKVELKELELKLPINVKDLSIRLQEKPSILIKTLMGMGVLAAINQFLEESAVAKLCEKYGCRIKKAPDEEDMLLHMHQVPDKPQDLRLRAPVVTFMGHVDHGKTSLLDAIRKTKVVDSEHGGITQHIGAYRVVLPTGEITFLDTPGHEAFTAMRARGAKITDIVVLVVAADEGIMPQTQEAIDHARAAGVSIIVALNKVDKPSADIDKVKKELAAIGLNPEDWGGKTITVPVSAKTGQGIDQLLEMILLESQMLELKANPERLARGVVLEGQLTKGRGSVATLLVQNGTLKLNHNIIVGKYYGKIKAMFDAYGKSITAAGPSFPIKALGLSGVPEAGEQFFEVEDEKEIRELAVIRQEKEKQQKTKTGNKISLEDLYAQIKEGKIKELNLIIKADVQGSLGAIKDTLNKLNVSEIKLNIIHEGVGSINSSDLILATASNALILGFHVTADERAKELAEKEGIDVRTYSIIYELANDIKAALEGMLEPRLKRVFLGKVEIRKVFKISRSGIVAGCYVTKGKVMRNSLINLVRNGEVVFEGKLSSLKRFKDDVREVAEGFECGITLANFENFLEGDIIEAYDIEKIARKLEE